MSNSQACKAFSLGILVQDLLTGILSTSPMHQERNAGPPKVTEGIPGNLLSFPIIVNKTFQDNKRTNGPQDMGEKCHHH